MITVKVKSLGLIRTKKVFFQLDQFPSNGYGWPHDIYFDQTSNTYRVLNCPERGMELELSEMPEDGPFEFETETPIQYAKDRFVTTHHAKIK